MFVRCCHITAAHAKSFEPGDSFGKVGAADSKGYIRRVDVAESERSVPEGWTGRMRDRIADNSKNLACARNFEIHMI